MDSNTIRPGDVISVARTVLHIQNLYRHFGVYVGTTGLCILLLWEEAAKLTHG